MFGWNKQTNKQTNKQKVNQLVPLVTASYKSRSRKSVGLSIFIPLQDIALDRGPQEVLPGTHSLHDAWLSALGALSSSEAPPDFSTFSLRILGTTCVRGGEDVFEAFVQAMVELPVSLVVFGQLEMLLSWILVLYIEALGCHVNVMFLIFFGGVLFICFQLIIF